MAPGQQTIDLTASDSEASADDHDQFQPEAVAYSRWKLQLLHHLRSITSAGDFAVSRQYQTFVNPCLRIAGCSDVIPLPVAGRDAETIRSACREAPFGRGDETLVDTSVRRTWELDAAHFACTNPRWPAFLDRLLEDVAGGLGLPDFRAKPHKLLLYQEGSFFRRHKDSEKEFGMIATLVVCLPAVHQGGTVHLSFGSERREIATAPASAFDMTALAWFSDVDHEIRPLTSGNRLVLTYKLFQAGAGAGGGTPSAELLVRQLQQLRGILGQWPARFPHALMLAYPLDHQYTRSSLSLANLKGRDRAVCQTLHEASAACDVYLVLAHMTHSKHDPESWYGEEEEDGSTVLRTMFTTDGAEIASHHDVDETEILGGDIFQNRHPDSEDEGEFTGNESVPSCSRYHNTVAVLIPKLQIHQYLRTHVYGWSPSAEAENLFSMVERDMEEHPENSVVRSGGLRLMTKALDAGATKPAMLCRVAKWALAARQDELYRKVIKAAISGGPFPPELLDVLSRHFDWEYAREPRDVDWEKWLGSVLHALSLCGWRSLAKLLATRLETEALRDSFSLWAQEQLEKKLDHHTSFVTQDFDYFLEKLSQADPSSRILSAFAERGKRELILKVLETLSQRRAPEAVKGIFEATLDKARPRLVLQTGDFYTPAAPWAHHMQGADKSREPCQQFTNLVRQSLRVGASDQAVRLIEETYRHLDAAARTSWNRSGIDGPSLVKDLLVPLAAALQQCGGEAAPTDGVAGFFALLIRDVLHYNNKVGPYPQKLPGWRHRPRGCAGACADCDALRAFLYREDQRSWVLAAGAQRRAHVESQLPASVFSTQTQTQAQAQTQTGSRSRAPGLALVVEKRGTEHAEEVAEFAAALARLEGVLAPLRGGFLAGLLGDRAYRALVLLEGYREQVPEGSLPWRKRPSDTPLAGDTVRQRW